jgi:hypothetical protein
MNVKNTNLKNDFDGRGLIVLSRKQSFRRISTLIILVSFEKFLLLWVDFSNKQNN